MFLIIFQILFKLKKIYYKKYHLKVNKKFIIKWNITIIYQSLYL